MPIPMPAAMMPEQLQDDDDDDFTFPTPPQLLAVGRHHDRACRVFHLPCTSPSPLSSPIRRSFSAADCAASPWRARAVLVPRRADACSSALSDYAAGLCTGHHEDDEEEEEEERMDSLWEDLNDAEAGEAENLLLGSRRSVGGLDAGGAGRRRAAKEREAAALAASRSARRRAPGLVVMMRALKKMLVAHKAKSSKVHKADEQSTASSAKSVSSSSCNKW